MDYSEVFLTEGDIAAESWYERNQERLQESEWKEDETPIGRKLRHKSAIKVFCQRLDKLEVEAAKLTFSQEERRRLELRFIELRLCLLEAKMKLELGAEV